MKNDKCVLPDFLIVGSGKCGTTALKHYLVQHPEVFVYPREIHFFDHDENYNKGFSFYLSFFQGVDGEKAIGDESPGYMYEPVAAGRIHKCLPDVKLIFMLRDPVDRAFSEYRMHVLKKIERCSFEDAIVGNEVYLKQGFYSEQIKNLLEFFPKEQMFFIVSEEFRRNKEKIMRQVLNFLGVDDGFVFCDLSDRHVGLRSKSFFYSLLLLLYEKIGVDSEMLDGLSGMVKSFFVRLDVLKKPLVLNEETRRRLIEYYRVSNGELEQLIGRDDLGCWWGGCV